MWFISKRKAIKMDFYNQNQYIYPKLRSLKNQLMNNFKLILSSLFVTTNFKSKT